MDAHVARTAEGMAMNQARVGLLVAAALVAMPMTALAQPKGRQPKATAGKNPKDTTTDKAAAAPAAEGDAKEVNVEGADAPKEDPAAAGTDPATAGIATSAAATRSPTRARFIAIPSAVRATRPSLG